MQGLTQFVQEHPAHVRVRCSGVRCAGFGSVCIGRSSISKVFKCKVYTV